ncbi:hypothetical protein ACI1AD_004397 [Cronobacter dublinensis]
MGKRSQSIRSPSRKEELKVAKSPPVSTDRFVSVSFRYLCNVDDVGQSIKTWHDDGSLPDLIDKLTYLTSNGITKVITDGVFTNYSRFPEAAVNEFKCPDGISEDEDWGVIKNIGGQKRRVAGFLRENIFYVVFLDRDHLFWKSKR